jgi:hypothetical protein
LNLGLQIFIGRYLGTEKAVFQNRGGRRHVQLLTLQAARDKTSRLERWKHRLDELDILPHCFFLGEILPLYQPLIDNNSIFTCRARDLATLQYFDREGFDLTFWCEDWKK